MMDKIENINKQLIESKEMYKNVSDGLTSLRLEVKSLSSLVCPKRNDNQTHPPSLNLQRPINDSFVSSCFFR